MISTLTPLQDAVEQQLSGSVGTPTKPAPPIDALCAQALSEMSVSFRQIHTPKMASQGVNQCYAAISHLLDQLWSEPRLSSYFEAMKKLYFRFELSFSLYFLPDNTPPLYLQHQLSEETEQRLRIISPRLASKAIPKSYIQELKYALKSLFNFGKQPTFHYAHLSYLPKLFDALEQMASDGRDKVWADRYVFLMIHFNFNYAGFFNRWSELLTETLQQLDTAYERQQYLAYIEQQLKLSYYSTDLCFDQSRETLLAQMVLYISEAIDKLEDDNLHGTADEQDLLLTRLSGNELNLLFYYFYKAKIFDYHNKREAAQAFSKYIMSSTRRRISYKTLQKFERDDLEPSAVKIKRLLKAVIQAIEQDFKH